MKVYHCPNARSLRVIWAAEELNLDIEVQALGFPPRVREPEYFDINPTATIPAFVDGDLMLVESMAIAEHLAEQKGANDLIVAPGDPDRPYYSQFVLMGEATLVPPLTKIVRYRMLEPKDRRLPQAVDDGAAEFIDRLKHVSSRLEGRDWLAGGRFSLADISVGYALHLGQFLRLGDRMPVNVAAYLERLQARPAFQRAMARN
jgi:glutathione S-transferase